MKIKSIYFWNNCNEIVVRIQKVWRGYAIRHRLKLAGKGVLKRSLCHNDDEMVTCESKTTVHPFDYFSIEEDGNIWWFDQRSMIEWSQQGVDVRNPFTRRVLAPEAMKRLVALNYIRRKHRMKITHSDPVQDPDIEYLRDSRWLRVAHILHAHGYRENVHPNNFISMEFEDIENFLIDLFNSTRLWMYENTYVPGSFRHKIFLAVRSLRNSMHLYTSTDEVSHNCAGILLYALNELKDPTHFVKLILDAAVKNGVLAADL